MAKVLAVLGGVVLALLAALGVSLSRNRRSRASHARELAESTARHEAELADGRIRDEIESARARIEAADAEIAGGDASGGINDALRRAGVTIDDDPGGVL